MIDIPSPAVAFVGRHNSGKTTLVEKVIAELSSRGLDVGSVKHHHREGFEIDIPGKDSYRHRAAGATETFISAPGQIANIKSIEGEMECSEIVRKMPGHDIVIVEGYRKSGLPTIEIMRSGNAADSAIADLFAEAAAEGVPLDTDFTQLSRGERAFSGERDDRAKMPSEKTVAIATDIPKAREAAAAYGIPAFDLDDIQGICDFVKKRFARPKVTVAIQAGGESKRMGRSKATVPFAGRPLMVRMVERLAPVADELIITTNEPENLAFLFEEFPEYDIKLVTDATDVRGAVPGLYTAVNAASNPFVAVVACDMVFASPRLIVAEAIVMEETRADVVVPVNKHGFEPFHSVYRRKTCLPELEELVKMGNKRAQALYERVNVYEMSRAQVLAVEPMGGCFLNANTPDELHALEKLVQDA